MNVSLLIAAPRAPSEHRRETGGPLRSAPEPRSPSSRALRPRRGDGRWAPGAASPVRPRGTGLARADGIADERVRPGGECPEPFCGGVAGAAVRMRRAAAWRGSDALAALCGRGGEASKSSHPFVVQVDDLIRDQAEHRERPVVGARRLEVGRVVPVEDDVARAQILEAP